MFDSRKAQVDSYAVGPKPAPLLTETIGSNFMASVASHPEREALVDGPDGRRWTYSELSAEVDAVALGLLALGVAVGDRVGIWAPNCAEWVFVQFATARIGAILVNVNPSYRAHELSFVLRDSGVRTLIAVAEFKGSSYADMIELVRPECPELVDVVLIGTSSWAAMAASGRLGDRTELERLGSQLSAGDPINIQYTSGTTGFPKGATLSHSNILNNGYFVGELLNYTKTDRICIAVPFYHCFGMVMGNLAATSHGAAMVIPAPSFDANLTLETIAEERCTSLYGVPTMFISMLSDPDFSRWDLSTLRTGIMAGSPCPSEVMKQVIERMGVRDISICYGMTETSPVSMQTRTDSSFETRVSTVGLAHPHLEVKIVDPHTGAVLPRGQIGEFCARGYSVMMGYWNAPEKTAEVIDADGWMHSGDLGVMDDEDYVSISGRIKDLVIRGGENVYPREIEEFLMTHPAILDAQVIGVPDEKYGEELMAWLRMKPGEAPLDSTKLRDFATGRLAYYKIPRYVHVVDEFPMTVTGKVRKVEMREAAITMISVQK